MVNNIYQLKYDDVIDKDIHDWLADIPSNRKAEIVRHALRYYLTYNGQELTPRLTPPIKMEELKKERIRPKGLNLFG
jgi:hypothetical protein